MVKKIFLLLSLVLTLALLASSAMGSFLVPQTKLDPTLLDKYVDALPTFVGNRVTASTYTVKMLEFQQQVLPSTFPYPAPFTGTYVFGYKVDGKPALYPGFTVEAQRGVPNTVTYLNSLGAPTVPPVLQKYITVDQTLDWANPLGLAPGDPRRGQPYIGPQPAVAHLHGGEVRSDSDGGPDAWWTPGAEAGVGPNLFRGMTYVSNIYTYPNAQEAATLWFHDHLMGGTRLNVYAGLAAFYFLRGVPESLVTPSLPSGAQEIEIALQDRQFDTNGQLLFPDGFPGGLNGPPTNPDIHPFWNPEFIGNVIVINGKVWPFFNVEPRRYRFRFLGGSNARFYNLNIPGVPIYVIGTEGGLLNAPAQVNNLLIAPGERYDTIVDFAPLAGQTVVMTNNARIPFPGGSVPPTTTTGQIMQFRVGPGPVADNSFNPAVNTVLRANPNKIVRLPGAPGGPAIVFAGPGRNVHKYRQLTLNEVMGPGGPIDVLVNNTGFRGLRSNGVPIVGSIQVGANFITERPRVGATEVWDIINLTGDAHPIHLHLVQFQIVSRTAFNATTYSTAYDAAFPGGVFIPQFGPPNNYLVANADGAVGGNPAVNSFLTAAPTKPPNQERGWKDTVIARPGQVTRIVVRWAPQDVALSAASPGVNLYPFDPTLGPGYVWHCHIVDHEDNEMMRPYSVFP